MYASKDSEGDGKEGLVIVAKLRKKNGETSASDEPADDGDGDGADAGEEAGVAAAEEIFQLCRGRAAKESEAKSLWDALKSAIIACKDSE